MKSIFYLIACSFCAACCLFAETTEKQSAGESAETVACINCNRPSCGGCGKLACEKCKSLFLIDENNQLANCCSQGKDKVSLAGCPCKGKGKKDGKTTEPVLA